MKKKVLILCDYYIPGVKGGGPIQSVKNITDNLNDEFDFYVITRDRDLGDTQPYSNIKQNSWQTVENAQVYYINPSNFKVNNFIKLLNQVDYEILYLNTFFGIKMAILPIVLVKLKKIKNCKIVLAPRGQFSSGALKIKKYKKKIYINIFKFLRLQNNILWHATTEFEKKDITSILGDKIKIKIANNLTIRNEDYKYTKNINKEIGKLKIVFLSRITPKKNLKKAIKLLKGLKGDVIFDIYGPVEDKLYWDKCKREIETLESNVVVNYKGIIKHSEVKSIFEKYHVFLFPTLGENFGHVISEALIGGCVVILSDQTPWRNLENFGVGWDIPLENEFEFKYAIQQCIDIGKAEYDNLSINSFKFGIEKSNSSVEIDKTREIFSI